MSNAIGILAAALVIGFGLAAPASATIPYPPPLYSHLEQVGECLSHYRYGSVSIALDDEETADAEPQLTAGETLRLSGTLTNGNEYPLPAGRLLARILREDKQVARAHWHPVVAEVELKGDFDLPANGKKIFHHSWRVPTGAPPGAYRAEFSYLAGQRFPLAGVPYVPNLPGTDVSFSVRDTSRPTALTFDRASVRLNGTPLALRAVPPALTPGQPVRLEARLRADGPGKLIAAAVKTTLYEWSDTDPEPPLTDAATEVEISPGQSVPVPFTWTPEQPGVYEVVLTATPADSRVLPSLLKVRVPVRGNAPRILYAGPGGKTGTGDVVMASCVLNSTEGEGLGSFTTRVLAGEKTIAETTGETAGELATTLLTIPADELRGGFAVEMTARTADGRVTDTHRTSYESAILTGFVPTRQKLITPARLRGQFAGPELLAAVVLGAVIAAVLLVRDRRRRRRSPPPLP